MPIRRRGRCERSRPFCCCSSPSASSRCSSCGCRRRSRRPSSLAPVRGTDPVRTLHDGIVATVNVEDAQRVARGRGAVRARVRAGRRPHGRAADARRAAVGRAQPPGQRAAEVRNQQRADEQEQQRLEQRLANLERRPSSSSSSCALSAGHRRAHAARASSEGVGSWMDASRQQARSRPAGRRARTDARPTAADARNALARLTFEMASRRAAFAEIERGIGEDLAAYRARKGVLDQDRAREGNAHVGGSAVRGHRREAARPQRGSGRARRRPAGRNRLLGRATARPSCCCPSAAWRSSAPASPSSCCTTRFRTSATACSTARCAG